MTTSSELPGAGLDITKADGNGEKQEAEEGVVAGSLQQVQVARFEVLGEVSEVKDIGKTAGLLGASAYPASLVSGRK